LDGAPHVFGGCGGGGGVDGLGDGNGLGDRVGWAEATGDADGGFFLTAGVGDAATNCATGLAVV